MAVKVVHLFLHKTKPVIEGGDLLVFVSNERRSDFPRKRLNIPYYADPLLVKSTSVNSVWTIGATSLRSINAGRI
jgi:hypothetical protein